MLSDLNMPRPRATGNAPFSSTLETAPVILSKLRSTPEGTTVIFPQSVMVTPRIDMEETADLVLNPVPIDIGVGPGLRRDRIRHQAGSMSLDRMAPQSVPHQRSAVPLR